MEIIDTLYMEITSVLYTYRYTTHKYEHCTIGSLCSSGRSDLTQAVLLSQNHLDAWNM